MLYFKIVLSVLLWVEKGYNCMLVIDLDNGYLGSIYNFWWK